MPTDVIQTGFGGGNDRATLFETALNRIGLTAYPVLLNSEGGVRGALPSIE